ncbi:MAG: hypothetical protein LQ342_003239 [Letrouitia transgressa]|nr:MAG: hypothetical protein LQ342_003239 [Letrouitia transgressa]
MLSRQSRSLALRFASPRAQVTANTLSTRSYAQAASIPDARPPIALYGIDGTYATALYTAAAKTSSLDSTSKSLSALTDVFKKDLKLSKILSAPTLTQQDKSQIVQELQKHMGGLDKNDTVKNFLRTLAENNRLGILQDVCEKFVTLMGAARGEMDLVVTSASKLDSKVLQRLETAVAKSEYSQGKKLKVVSEGDQREDHDSGRRVTNDFLAGLGVLYHHCPSMSTVDSIALDRSYKNRDEIIVSPQKMGDVYEEKVRMFFNEHLHEDEEIRYILDGTGFFDVRSKTDGWVRIRVEKDDLIILPAGIYHRFTTDTQNYIKAMRLFQDEPKWTPLNRTAGLEDNPVRKEYVAQH